MTQRISIGIDAPTAGAERNIGKVESAASDLAESLNSVSRSGQRAAAGISATGANDALKRVAKDAKDAADQMAHLEQVAKRLKNVQGILGKDLGHSVSETDAVMFLNNFEKMRSSRSFGSQRLRSFDSFESWHSAHAMGFKNQADADRHRRFVLASGMQSTPFASQFGGGSGAPPPGSSGGGGGRSPFARGVARASSSAMSFGMGMLGLAGIGGVMGMASQAIDLGTEESTGLDALKRRLGDLQQGDRVVFDVVQDAGGKCKATRLRLDENQRPQAASR